MEANRNFLDKLQEVSAQFLSGDFPERMLGRDYALGVICNKKVSWMVIRGGDNAAVELILAEKSAIFHDEMNLALVACADIEAWKEISVGGREAAVSIIDQERLTIAGNLPFFISRIDVAMDLLIKFSSSFEE